MFIVKYMKAAQPCSANKRISAGGAILFHPSVQQAQQEHLPNAMDDTKQRNRMMNMTLPSGLNSWEEPDN